MNVYPNDDPDTAAKKMMCGLPYQRVMVKTMTKSMYTLFKNVQGLIS